MTGPGSSPSTDPPRDDAEQMIAELSQWTGHIVRVEFDGDKFWVFWWVEHKEARDYLREGATSDSSLTAALRRAIREARS